LGLQLDTDDVQVFCDKLRVWLQGIYIYSCFAMLSPSLIKNHLPAYSYRAKEHIVSKIEEKVDLLLKNGPDQSMLSNMLFAVDKENGSAKLTREQVIENAQLLLLLSRRTQLAD
jgi:hypothetical protein